MPRQASRQLPSHPEVTLAIVALAVFGLPARALPSGSASTVAAALSAEEIDAVLAPSAPPPDGNTHAGHTRETVVASPSEGEKGGSSSSSPAAPQPDRPDLRQSLNLIEAMEPSGARTRLLIDLAETCLSLDCAIPLDPILQQVRDAMVLEKDPSRKVSEWIRLARLEARRGNTERAAGDLDKAAAVAHSVDSEQDETSRRQAAQLLLEVSLASQVIGSEEDAATLLAASRSLLRPPKPDAFPFRERPLRFSIGFGLSGHSFTQTDALLRLTTDAYKQWPRQDVYLSGIYAADYDDGRIFGVVRPVAESTLIYRYHLNPRWNVFLGNLLAVNTSAFATDSDDEDLSLTTVTYVGMGRNFWRGEHPGSFLDLQLGVGARYQYEYIDFEQLKDSLSPVASLILIGRDIPIGSASFSQILGIGTDLGEWSDAYALWDVTLKVPITPRWAWDTRGVLRYRSDTLVERNPNFNFLFSTGLSFTF